jgi:hypothetical protein
MALSHVSLFHAATQTATDPNPTARFGTSKNSNFYVTGEIVWFKPLSQETLANNRFQQGVRVALGRNTSYDRWDLFLSYTGLRYQHTNNPLDQLFSYYNKYNYNLVDLDLGRSFKISSKLKMRPHMGLRGVWFDQTYQKQSTSSQESDYFLICNVANTLYGPEGGIETYWNLCHGFSFYVHTVFSILVNSQKNSSSGSLTIDNYSTNYGSTLIPEFDFYLGLRWDKNFSHDSYHFSFNAGYEHHSYLNLNAPYKLTSSSDFNLQGIALGARCDF